MRKSLAGPALGYAFAVAATLIWSGNFIVARGLADAISPVLLAFLRWTVAALVVLPLAAPALWRQRAVFRQHAGYLTMSAFLGVTLFNTLIYIAGETTSALNLSLIAIGSSIFIIALARIALGERISARKAVGAVIAITGVLLLITDGDVSRLGSLQFAEGDLWMLAATLAFAGYSILVRKKPPEIEQWVFLAATFWIGLAMLAPWALWAYGSGPRLILSNDIVGAVLYIGIGASLTAYFLWNRAIALIGPTNVAVIYYLLPLFSGIEAFVILDEPATAVHVLSGGLIIGGVAWATRMPRAHAVSASSASTA